MAMLRSRLSGLHQLLRYISTRGKGDRLIALSVWQAVTLAVCVDRKFSLTYAPARATGTMGLTP